MEEYLIVSHNFGCPVNVIASGQRVTGLVEHIDEDDRVLIGGMWYPIEEVQYAQ